MLMGLKEGLEATMGLGKDVPGGGVESGGDAGEFHPLAKVSITHRDEGRDGT